MQESVCTPESVPFDEGFNVLMDAGTDFCVIICRGRFTKLCPAPMCCDHTLMCQESLRTAIHPSHIMYRAIPRRQTESHVDSSMRLQKLSCLILQQIQIEIGHKLCFSCGSHDNCDGLAHNAPCLERYQHQARFQIQGLLSWG